MDIIKFKPQLKQVLWGGEKIIPFKQLDDHLSQVGESWEISGVKGSESIATTTAYEGKDINSLVAQYQADLIGEENYARFGNEFPLLIKFIDARDQLSIQVHPDDAKAKARGKSKGKTEMWYIMESEPDARLRSGLKQVITPEEYAHLVETNQITGVLAEYNVKEGDVFFLPAGRIHSIGTGCFLAEIQQTSDVTYRIYDFKRQDAQGNYRELHTEEAAECIDYSVLPDYRTAYEARKNEGVELVSCPYFTTSVYDLDEEMVLDYSELDSFVILIALKGSATITDETGKETSLRAGETVLIPAKNTLVKISGNIKFLETFV